MTTQQGVMTTQEVADRFTQLAKEGKWELIQQELYADDAESLEPAGARLPNVKGKAALKKKSEDFNNSIEEMQGGWSSEPVVGGNFFSIAMGMTAKMKGAPQATNMDEIAVYEVRNGKIVKEQFFF